MPRIVKKPSERRLEITEVAQKLFLQKGYDATSLNEVIAALNIAKGTVYHYFKSKTELLEAVVDHMASLHLSAVRSEMEAQNGNAIQRLKSLALSMNVSEKWKDDLPKLHSSGNMSLHVKLLASLIRGFSPLLAHIVEDGCKEGVFKTRHPLETSEILLAGFQFITDLGVHPWNEEELKRRKAAFPAIAESMLNAPTGALEFLA